MSLKVEEWGTFEEVGRGYGFKHGGRFYAILQTKVGAYRGDHTHPCDQYTVLLSGRAKYLKFDGGQHEVPLVKGEAVMIEAGVPHVLVVKEDALTFEWWDGDFEADGCRGIFEEITRNRVGPKA